MHIITKAFRNSLLAVETGWTICSEEARVPDVTLEQVREMRQKGLIAREFQHYETSDLATTATLLVVKKGL